MPTQPTPSPQSPSPCRPAPLRFGGLEIDPPLVLAPMAGVTDQPFRALVRELGGVGLLVSEMLASKSMAQGHKRTLAMMAKEQGAKTPLAVQIAGVEPDVMAEAARLAEGEGADTIDLNMGCPAKKIVKSWAGAALMRDEPLAQQIVSAVAEAVSVPVTVKMRLGWDEQSRNAVSLAQKLENCGAQMFTVHGRTRDQMYGGQADWAAIAEVKQAVGVPVIANGDVDGPEAAVRILRETGADGVMIGRAALGRPWIFRQCAHYFATGDILPEPEVKERARIMLEHYQALLTHYGQHIGLRTGRKHLGWYAKGLPGAPEFRNQVNNTMDPDEVMRLIARFFGPDEKVAA